MENIYEILVHEHTFKALSLYMYQYIVLMQPKVMCCGLVEGTGNEATDHE